MYVRTHTHAHTHTHTHTHIYIYIESTTAHAAALALAKIAKQQLASDGRCISYGMLEPHVSAIMDWLRVLPSDDIAVRIQVPPVITPLRGILEHVLYGSATADDWASLVAVAEALEALCVGTDLVHRCASAGKRGRRHQPHR